MSLQDFRMGLTSAFNIVIELRSIEILIVIISPDDDMTANVTQDKLAELLYHYAKHHDVDVTAGGLVLIFIRSSSFQEHITI